MIKAPAKLSVSCLLVFWDFLKEVRLHCLYGVNSVQFLSTSSHLFVECYSYFSCKPELFKPTFCQYPFLNSLHIIWAVYHCRKWPIICLTKHLSSSHSSLRTRQNHMFDILKRISTLAFWFNHPGDFPSIQIRIETNVLTFYLSCNTALGPAMVPVDIRGCVSISNPFSACCLTCNNIYGFPMFRVCRCSITR